MKKAMILLFGFIGLVALTGFADEQVAGSPIAKNSKVYIASMPNDFHVALREAIVSKKVPVTIVDDKAAADFEITGTSESIKAGKAKKIIMWDWRSDEQASIRVANLKTGEIAFAYSASKRSSAHGQRSTAEACAKHLKEKIESGK